MHEHKPIHVPFPDDAPPALRGRTITFAIDPERGKLQCSFELPEPFAEADKEYALSAIRWIARRMGLDTDTEHQERTVFTN